MNAHESMLRNNYGLSSSNPMNSKDTEKNKVHFSNASNGPEKDDIISLYGTPKEEMLPGVSADGYRAEDEESLSHKGKLYLIKKWFFKNVVEFLHIVHMCITFYVITWNR